ncbi:hypothetical protein G6F61_000619 [Rhizopus arrhizus]|nr:hypothetical protein G6F61_000619 [Rhizopus arrhizus]
MDGEYDYLFKLVLIGDSEVGKSNIRSRFAKNEFDLNYQSTIGVDFEVKTIEFDNRIIKAQIWDTSGQARYRAITSAYYRGATDIFIVYDITSRSSFENARRWLKEIREYADPNVVIMLVVNKVDLSEYRRVVDTEEGRSLAEEEGLLFIETSAKDATNINTAFTTLIGKICSNLLEKPQADLNQPTAEKHAICVQGLFSSNEITQKQM